MEESPVTDTIPPGWRFIPFKPFDIGAKVRFFFELGIYVIVEFGLNTRQGATGNHTQILKETVGFENTVFRQRIFPSFVGPGGILLSAFRVAFCWKGFPPFR